MYLLMSVIQHADVHAVSHIAEPQARYMLSRLRVLGLLRKEYGIGSFTELTVDEALLSGVLASTDPSYVSLPGVWLPKIPELKQLLKPPKITVKVISDEDAEQIIPFDAEDGQPSTGRGSVGQWKFHGSLRSSSPYLVDSAAFYQPDGTRTYPIFEEHLQQVLNQEQSP